MGKEEKKVYLWRRLASQVRSMVLLQLKACACFSKNMCASVYRSKFLLHVFSL